jgi:AcrR family transcriptional regulator
VSPHEVRGLVGRSAATISIRDQILLAALECFLEKGYQGTSVRDIANRTELSVPGLYHHFESKMAMLEELMNETMDDLISDVRDAFELARPDPVTRFEAVVESHVRFHCERQEESFLGNSELRSLPVDSRARLIEKRREVQRHFEIVVEDGMEAEVFRVKWPHETARALASMCVAVASWYHPDGELSPNDVVAIYRDLGLQLVGFRGLTERSLG